MILNSCNKDFFIRNPFINLPIDLKEGVVGTGIEHYFKFNPLVVRNTLRVRVQNEEDLVLNFEEGDLKSYNIKFDLLNDFENTYEILFLDNPFKKLKDSEWKYNPKTKIAELTWRPSETFNKGSPYVINPVNMNITLKKIKAFDTDSDLTVVRHFQVFVHKKIKAPEIVRLGTEYKNFIKLEDGKFYNNTGFENLDFSYHNEFVIMQTSAYNWLRTQGMKFGTKVLARDVLHPKIPFFSVNKEDKNKGISLPYNLMIYMQRPYYQLDTVSEDVNCIYFNEENKNLCWRSLQDIENVNFDRDVYVRNYVIPRDKEVANLYYKVESFELCKAYNNIYDEIKVNFPVFKKSLEESKGEFCYISLVSVNREMTVIPENKVIYELKGEDFILVSKSHWQNSFEKIKTYVKMQMSGYYPLNEIDINIFQTRREFVPNLFFEVEDKSYSSRNPQIYFENVLNHTVLSSLPFNIKFRSVEKVSPFIFKLNFDFFPKVKGSYESYEFQVVPFLNGIYGETVNFFTNIFPHLIEETEYSFDIQKDNILANDLIQENLQKRMFIKAQVKKTYIFPESFYSHLDFYNSESKIDSLKKHLLLNKYRINPISEICLNEASFIFNKGTCFCSENIEFYMTTEEEDKNIYAQMQCDYENLLGFLPSHLESGYFQFEYGINNLDINLKVFDFKKSKQVNFFPLDFIKKEYLFQDSLEDFDSEENPRTEIEDDLFSEENPRTEIEDDLFSEGNPRTEIEDDLFSENIFHIFYNLTPQWKCENSLQNNKTICQFMYLIKGKLPNKLKIEDTLQVDTKCSYEEGKNNKDYECECGKVELLDFENIKKIQFRCNFDLDRKSVLKYFLKTQIPSVYFLNKEIKDIKRTPEETYTNYKRSKDI